MSQQLTLKQRQLVAHEIRSWMDERLIDDQVARKLLSRYPETKVAVNVSGVLSLVGSILVGLGTLLFIAANWQQIAVVPKLGLIVAAICGAHYAGWKLRFEPGNHPKLGSALLLLGSLFYGGGIWLIGQIFNLDGSFADAMLLWSIGTVAVTYVTRLVPLGCLSALLLSAWTFSNHHYFWDSSFTGNDLPSFVAATVVSLFLAWYLRSRSVAWVTMIAGSIWMLTTSAPCQAILLWGLASFGIYLWCREKRQLFEAPFLYVGTTCALSSLLIGTFGAPSISVAAAERLPILLFSSVVILLAVSWRVPKYRIEALTAIILAIAGCLTYGYAEGASKIVFNIFLLATIGGLAHTGLNRIQSIGLVNVAIVFFVFDVIARYFDFFFTMMNRSMFFIIGGIILMIVGSVAETGRRRLIEGFKTAESVSV